MSKAAIAVAVLILAQIQGPNCQAQPVGGRSGSTEASQAKTCIIVQFDVAMTNFTCQEERDTRTYWVRRATRFVSGQRNASFLDLAYGKSVVVISHRDGGFEIADVVRL
jgi:hypothetical protein